MLGNFYSKYDEFLALKIGFNWLTFVLVLLFFALPNYASDTYSKVSKTAKKKTVSKKSESPSLKRKESEAKKVKSNGRLAIRSRLMMDKPLSKFTDKDRKRNRQNLEALRRQPATQRFFAVVQEGEGGSPKIMVGNRCPKLTEKLDLSKHPGEVLPSKSCFYWYVNKKGKLVFSTASGNYQITRDNYRKIAPFLDIKDFKVLSQQLIALELMRRGNSNTKDGLLDLAQGNTRKAVCAGTQDWASSKCSTLEASSKTDYQKIYDRQMREAAKASINRKNVTKRNAVKLTKNRNVKRKTIAKSKK